MSQTLERCLDSLDCIQTIPKCFLCRRLARVGDTATVNSSAGSAYQWGAGACVYRSSELESNSSDWEERAAEHIQPATDCWLTLQRHRRVYHHTRTVWASRLLDLSGLNKPEAAGASQQTIGDESLYSRFTFAGYRRLFTQHRGWVCVIYLFFNILFFFM